MCGRFTQTKSRTEVLKALGPIKLPPLFHGRYNVAPSQTAPILTQSNPDTMLEACWGFDHPKTSAQIINARSETISERPLFKNLISGNRCLIPSDGFYEWMGKQPYYFQLIDHSLFAFAGLWKDNRFVILTRSADCNMCNIHDRMPVILPVQRWSKWLTDSYELPNVPALCNRPVSRLVNNVKHDTPACLDAGEVQTDLFLFPDEG